MTKQPKTPAEMLWENAMHCFTLFKGLFMVVVRCRPLHITHNTDLSIHSKPPLNETKPERLAWRNRKIRSRSEKPKLSGRYAIEKPSGSPMLLLVFCAFYFFSIHQKKCTRLAASLRRSFWQRSRSMGANRRSRESANEARSQWMWTV